jgi:uncharacterized membrane protein YqjE
MATEPEDLPLGEDDVERTWSERAASVAGAAKALIATRLEIFEEEINAKAGLFGRGVAAVAAGAALGIGALLLLAALLAAVFAQLFHNVALGILVAMLVYAGGAAFAGRAAWKALSAVKPTRYPETTRELARDLEALRAALATEDEDGGFAPPGAAPGGGGRSDEREVGDLEARVREVGE